MLLRHTAIDMGASVVAEDRCWCGGHGLADGMTWWTWHNRTVAAVDTTRDIRACQRTREYAHKMHAHSLAAEAESGPPPVAEMDRRVWRFLALGGRCNEQGCAGHDPEWEPHWPQPRA